MDHAKMRTRTSSVVLLFACAAFIAYLFVDAQSPPAGNAESATPPADSAPINVSESAWEIPMSPDLTNPLLTNVPNDVDFKVFLPKSDAWHTVKRSEVKPGQQFFVSRGIAKQGPQIPLHDLYFPVDRSELAEAYRPVLKRHPSRRPRADDFVYVLADEPLNAGFKPLAFLRPGQRFRFQGHIYKIGEGTQPQTMLIQDTGETIDDYPTAIRRVPHAQSQRAAESK